LPVTAGDESRARAQRWYADELGLEPFALQQLPEPGRRGRARRPGFHDSEANLFGVAESIL